MTERRWRQRKRLSCVRSAEQIIGWSPSPDLTPAFFTAEEGAGAQKTRGPSRRTGAECDKCRPKTPPPYSGASHADNPDRRLPQAESPDRDRAAHRRDARARRGPPPRADLAPRQNRKHKGGSPPKPKPPPTVRIGFGPQHLNARSSRLAAEQPTPEDAFGPYTRAQLLRMNWRFVRRVERAFKRGTETRAAASARYDSQQMLTRLRQKMRAACTQAAPFVAGSGGCD